jgi:hypothetical protein
MRKFLFFVAVPAALSSTPARSQVVAAPPQGSDAAASASSESRSRGTETSAADQLLQREQMQDISTAKKTVSLGRARPAKAAELLPGAAVNDKAGVLIAKIDQVDADGVIISTGAGKVKIPADAFGHNNAGLLLDMTKAQFDQIVAKAKAAS